MTQQLTGIYWLTGLSGAGKTTLSLGVADLLRAQGHPCLVLDGDIMRAGLNSDLGFSPEDRRENLRRAGEVARLVAQQGQVCLCAFITPYQATRNTLRQRLGPLYREIFVSCPLESCVSRDPKGNYARARREGRTDYTGIGAPYETPDAPDVRVETNTSGIDDCVRTIVQFIYDSQPPRQGDR